MKLSNTQATLIKSMIYSLGVIGDEVIREYFECPEADLYVDTIEYNTCHICDEYIQISFSMMYSESTVKHLWSVTIDSDGELDFHLETSVEIINGKSTSTKSRCSRFVKLVTKSNIYYTSRSNGKVKAEKIAIVLLQNYITKINQN